MAIQISARPPEEIQLPGGRTIPLFASFDRILSFVEIMRAGDLDQQDKHLAAGAVLFGRAKLNPDEFTQAINAASEILFPKSKAEPGPRAFDFWQDADLIYAGFRQAYGIDLHAEIGHLHWLQFLALLSGLPSSTRFCEVVQIRLRPIPKPTKHNQEEIRKLMELKARYRIRMSEEEEQNQFQAGLQRLAKSLMKGG